MKCSRLILIPCLSLAPFPVLAVDDLEAKFTRVDRSLPELLKDGYPIVAAFVADKRYRYVLQKGNSTIQCTLYRPDAWGKTGNVKSRAGVVARSRCRSLTD